MCRIHFLISSRNIAPHLLILKDWVTFLRVSVWCLSRDYVGLDAVYWYWRRAPLSHPIPMRQQYDRCDEDAPRVAFVQQRGDNTPWPRSPASWRQCALGCHLTQKQQWVRTVWWCDLAQRRQWVCMVWWCALALSLALFLSVLIPGHLVRWQWCTLTLLVFSSSSLLLLPMYSMYSISYKYIFVSSIAEVNRTRRRVSTIKIYGLVSYSTELMWRHSAVWITNQLCSL